MARTKIFFQWTDGTKKEYTKKGAIDFMYECMSFCDPHSTEFSTYARCLLDIRNGATIINL